VNVGFHEARRRTRTTSGAATLFDKRSGCREQDAAVPEIETENGVALPGAMPPKSALVVTPNRKPRECRVLDHRRAMTVLENQNARLCGAQHRCRAARDASSQCHLSVGVVAVCSTVSASQKRTTLTRPTKPRYGVSFTPRETDGGASRFRACLRRCARSRADTAWRRRTNLHDAARRRFAFAVP